MSAADLRADAQYVIAYYEDACVTGAKGPCPAENAAVRVAEALLVRLETPPVPVFVLLDFLGRPVAACPTVDMAKDEGLRLARLEFPDWQFRWVDDSLSGTIKVPNFSASRPSLYKVCHLTMGATSSP